MPTLQRLIIELDAELAQKLKETSKQRGWSPEALAAECVAQNLEIAARHKVLVERFEVIDDSLAMLARFVGDATASGEGIDLTKICRYGRKSS